MSLLKFFFLIQTRFCTAVQLDFCPQTTQKRPQLNSADGESVAYEDKCFWELQFAFPTFLIMELKLGFHQMD